TKAIFDKAEDRAESLLSVNNGIRWPPRLSRPTALKEEKRNRAVIEDRINEIGFRRSRPNGVALKLCAEFQLAVIEELMQERNIFCCRSSLRHASAPYSDRRYPVVPLV